MDDVHGFSYYGVFLSQVRTQVAGKGKRPAVVGWTFSSYAYMIPCPDGSGKYAVLTENWQQFSAGAFHALK